MTRPDKIKAYLLQHIPKHPKDVVAKTAKQFKITPTTVHRHLNALVKQNKVIKSGATRQINYFISEQRNRTYQFNAQRALSEHIIWEKYLANIFNTLPENVFEILQYGFTEIFNNAIDHAQAKSITVNVDWKEDTISLCIKDDGIGVFKRISNLYHFADFKECLLHLSKGKLTTDPINHSGEGLFFTSRVFDRFSLCANGLCYIRDNTIHDWTVENIKSNNDTEVLMEISQHSNKKLINVFNQFTDVETYTFNKTELLVELSRLAGERLISRSQAKRLLSHLEPFKSITLDFSRVRSVGQGFIDEIFRVYILKNPQVKIEYLNANEEVKFMIQRGSSI